MKRRRSMFLILPTAELLREPPQTNQLLEVIDLDLKTLAEALMLEWAQVHGNWAHDSNPFETSTFELVTRMVFSDYVVRTAYVSLPEDVQQDLWIMVCRFSRVFFDTIISIVDELNLSQHQLLSMRCHIWLSRSMVLDIPA